jgi:hypothetical protein
MKIAYLTLITLGAACVYFGAPVIGWPLFAVGAVVWFIDYSNKG